MATVNDTLFIRCLPTELTQDEKEDLLKHFGASSVRCMPETGQMKNSAFAIFTSEEAAREALTRLHQLDVLGNRLIVQFAIQQQNRYFPHLGGYKKPNLTTKATENESVKSKTSDFQKQVEAMQRNMNSLSMLFGLNYPINPKLRYSYPEPTETILTNIVHALISVPKFYTQVLHLMNKLNLPAPFGEETPSPPLDNKKNNSSESELESDDEFGKTSNFAVKRSKMRKQNMKKFKIQDMLNSFTKTTPSQSTIVEKENVFETQDSQATKKIEFKLNLENIAKNAEQEKENEDINESGFGQFAPVKLQNEKVESDGNEVDSANKSDYISRDEIKRNKISKEEMNSLPVYKKYTPGQVTSRLYIKNLAKQVSEADLQKIFGFYVNEESEEEKLRFDIVLMKVGHMKGQAFVTLPNEDKAKTALDDTNGYVLYGKPLVVQFARSAKAKEVAKTE